MSGERVQAGEVEHFLPDGSVFSKQAAWANRQARFPALGYLTGNPSAIPASCRRRPRCLAISPRVAHTDAASGTGSRKPAGEKVSQDRPVNDRTGAVCRGAASARNLKHFPAAWLDTRIVTARRFLEIMAGETARRATVMTIEIRKPELQALIRERSKADVRGPPPAVPGGSGQGAHGGCVTALARYRQFQPWPQNGDVPKIAPAGANAF